MSQPLPPYRDLPLTEVYASYSRSTDFSAIPDDVVDYAKRVILDTLGCMVMGSALPPGRLMASYVRSIQGAPEATVVGAGFRAPAAYAALANGTSCHADEMDGSHLSWGHPASVAVPMALAACQAHGRSGTDFINAVVLAHDLGSRLVIGVGGRPAIQDAHHGHSTALYAIGAAAAVGRLLNLEQLPMHHAFALAAHNISAPIAFMDERHHMTKAMTHGQSAFAGVSGASLAALGFEAHDNVLEAKNGILDCWWTDEGDLSVLTADLGEHFSVTDTAFKYYSAGYPIHAPLYSALRLVEENSLDVADIERIRVGMTTQTAEVVDGRDMPSISLQAMLSLGLVLGHLYHEDAHDEAALDRPEVRRLMGRVDVVRDPALDAEVPKTRGAWLELEMSDGTKHFAPKRMAPGHWDLGGAPWNDVEEKFTHLVDGTLGAGSSGAAIALVHDLEAADNLDVLADALSGTATG